MLDKAILAEAVGKLVTGGLGLVMGVLLFGKWRETRNRVVLHWAVFFMGAVGYVLGSLAILGRGNPAAMSRLQLILGAATVLLGALPSAMLMLPVPTAAAEVGSLYVPLALFALLSMLFMVAPLEPTGQGQALMATGVAINLYVGACMLTATLAIVALLYSARRTRDARYVILALAFAMITMGASMVGHELLSVLLGQVMIVLSFVIFYVVFGRLLRAGQST